MLDADTTGEGSDRVEVGRDLLIAVGDAHPGVVVCIPRDGLDEDFLADDADLAGRIDVEVVAPCVAVRSSSYACLIGPAEQVLSRVGWNLYEGNVCGGGSTRGGVHSTDEVGVVAAQREQHVVSARRDGEAISAAGVRDRKSVV